MFLIWSQENGLLIIWEINGLLISEISNKIYCSELLRAYPFFFCLDRRWTVPTGIKYDLNSNSGMIDLIVSTGMVKPLQFRYPF